MLSSMLSSTLLSSTVFMIAREGILASIFLIAYLIMKEVLDERAKKIFTPILAVLTIIFFSLVVKKIFEVL